MRNILLLPIVILVSACGNSNFSGEPNPLKKEAALSSPSGLLLEVKNNLPEEQVGESRIKPHLNAYFCVPLVGDPSNNPQPVENRCTQLTGVISNGQTETFLISRSQLESIYQKGNGYGAFEFADDRQSSSVPWPCNPPHHKTRLDSNFDSRQDWKVEVNQRYSIHYGCLINHTR